MASIEEDVISEKEEGDQQQAKARCDCGPADITARSDRRRAHRQKVAA
jgi:hypothetical protein